MRKPAADLPQAVGIDLDGVVYLGNEVIPGAPEAIADLRRSGVRVFALTNNSARTCAEISAKLRLMGVEIDPDEVVSSALATALYLAEAKMSAVAVIGSDSLKLEIERAGLSVVEDARAQALVVGYKPDFSYADVRYAMSVLSRGTSFVACNLERAYPIGEGMIVPGCGPGVMAIAHAAARSPDWVTGKPSAYFMNIALKRADARPEGFLMVGDSWDSDIEMARAAGCRAVYVRHPVDGGMCTGIPGVTGAASLAAWVDSLVASVGAV